MTADQLAYKNSIQRTSKRCKKVAKAGVYSTEQLTTQVNNKAVPNISSISPSKGFALTKGLMLETSALPSLHGGTVTQTLLRRLLKQVSILQDL